MLTHPIPLLPPYSNAMINPYHADDIKVMQKAAAACTLLLFVKMFVLAIARCVDHHFAVPFRAEPQTDCSVFLPDQVLTVFTLTNVCVYLQRQS